MAPMIRKTGMLHWTQRDRGLAQTNQSITECGSVDTAPPAELDARRRNSLRFQYSIHLNGLCMRYLVHAVGHEMCLRCASFEPNGKLTRKNGL